MVIVNSELMTANPERWHASARTILEDRTQTTDLKERLVWEIGRRAVGDRICRAD